MMKIGLFKSIKITALLLSVLMAFCSLNSFGYAYDSSDDTPIAVAGGSEQIPRALPGSEYSHWGTSDVKERAAMLARYEATVASIMAGINSSWPAEEKIIYLHDYIATHCQYAINENGQVDESDVRVHSAYGCLVMHRAVCDGYARAFSDIANRLGIETYVVSSNQLNHGWNMVRIGNKHYYVDVTQDDPVGTDSIGFAGHYYCLKSGAYFYNDETEDGVGHHATDWVINYYYNAGVSGSTNVFGVYNDTEYDNAVWTSCDSAMVCRNGYMLYLDDIEGTRWGNALVNRYIKKCIPGYPNSCTNIRQVTDSIYNDSFLIDIYGNMLLSTCTGVEKVDYDGSSCSYSEIISMSNASYMKRFKKVYINGTTLCAISEQSTDADPDYLDSSWTNPVTTTKDLRTNGMPNIGAQSVSLNRNCYFFNGIGQTVTLVATPNPSTAGVSWSSSNTSVATVNSSGRVTAVGYGSAYIKATSGNQQMWCYVEVTGITPPSSAVNMNFGDGNRSVSVIVNPASTKAFSSLNWSSSNESVVRPVSSNTAVSADGVCSNALSPRGKGSAVITVSSSDGAYSASFTVNVSKTVASVSIVGNRSCYEGTSGTLTCSPYPADAEGDLTVTWTSSDSSIVSIDNNGNYRALKPGKATITASIQGKSASITFTVYTAGVEFVWIKEYPMNMKVGKTYILKAGYLPADAAGDLTPSWTSLNPEVATIDSNGKVTPVSAGRVTIVCSIQGCEKSVTINVTDSSSGNNGESSDTVLMFRLYNPNSGEHLYTSDQNERNVLIYAGWTDEEEAWESPKYSDTPVYRLYNHNSGEHHYTKDWNEVVALYTVFSGNNTENDIKNQGWDYEGIGWYSAGTDGKPLYRLYNPNAKGQFEPGSHHYTKDLNERNTLISLGWNEEGIGWYSN